MLWLNKFLVLIQWNVQSTGLIKALYSSLLGKHAQLNTVHASLGSIKPCCGI